MRKFCLVLLMLAPAISSAGPQEPAAPAPLDITLAEACDLAAARSEALAASAEGLRRLEAAERAAYASFRPYLDAYGSASKEQNADASYRAYLSAGYSVFSGMRDYISLKAAGALKETSALRLAAARRRLRLDAARAYLDLYAARAESAIRLEQLAVTEKRVGELDARAAIGRSRRSETVAARAQLAQDKASYQGALAAESAAREALMFLTGSEAPLVPALPPVRAAGPLGSYLRSALGRDDLAAARKEAGYYSLILDLRDRALWPEAAVTADYYPLRSPMPSPENRWNAALRVKVPLYDGGAAAAGRLAAYSDLRSAELEASGAGRQALSEVRAAYEELRLASQQALSQEEALALASENAALQAEDYRMSLVTNLEVISAMNAVQSARLALSQARVRRCWALLRLENAAGLEIK